MEQCLIPQPKRPHGRPPTGVTAVKNTSSQELSAELNDVRTTFKSLEAVQRQMELSLAEVQRQLPEMRTLFHTMEGDMRRYQNQLTPRIKQVCDAIPEHIQSHLGDIKRVDQIHGLRNELNALQGTHDTHCKDYEEVQQEAQEYRTSLEDRMHESHDKFRREQERQKKVIEEVLGKLSHNAIPRPDVPNIYGAISCQQAQAPQMPSVPESSPANRIEPDVEDGGTSKPVIITLPVPPAIKELSKFGVHPAVECLQMDSHSSPQLASPLTPSLPVNKKNASSRRPQDLLAAIDVKHTMSLDQFHNSHVRRRPSCAGCVCSVLLLKLLALFAFASFNDMSDLTPVQQTNEMQRSSLGGPYPMEVQCVRAHCWLWLTGCSNNQLQNGCVVLKGGQSHTVNMCRTQGSELGLHVRFVPDVAGDVGAGLHLVSYAYAVAGFHLVHSSDSATRQLHILDPGYNIATCVHTEDRSLALEHAARVRVEWFSQQTSTQLLAAPTERCGHDLSQFPGNQSSQLVMAPEFYSITKVSQPPLVRTLVGDLGSAYIVFLGVLFLPYLLLSRWNEACYRSDTGGASAAFKRSFNTRSKKHGGQSLRGADAQVVVAPDER